MATIPVANDLISRAFFPALLLSGDSHVAEAAVVEAIECVDLDQGDEDQFLLHTIRWVLRQQGRSSLAADTRDAACFLPPELQRVLRLPPAFRRSFVLRVLLAMPREVCAILLHLDARQVDAATCAAVQQLARMTSPYFGVHVEAPQSVWSGSPMA